ncbi:hypothetical protein GDO81_012815 [Engystomops pustulosus]|uniref:Uncharacterized protein n=1 Tax=Engystomops pustulosus TaxID=76066 RepID=A0AAV7B295_ENGPU|nr:hypothetical protein GDO81_012815 [Engystomops pustulosus]
MGRSMPMALSPGTGPWDLHSCPEFCIHRIICLFSRNTLGKACALGAGHDPDSEMSHTPPL